MQKEKERLEELGGRLGLLQRQCKEAGIPVLILFDGYDAAGKGYQINRLLQALDPRGFDVYTGDKDGEEEAMRPFLWRFASKAPEKGRIVIFDTSWYRRVMQDRFDGKLKKHEIKEAFEDILAFEKQLAEDGTVLIKLFLDIPEKEQKKRFERLEESEESSWRVTEADWNRNRHYGKFKEIVEEALDRTSAPYAPWNVISAIKRDETALEIMEITAGSLALALQKKAEGPKEEIFEAPMPPDRYKKGILSQAALSLTMDRET